MLASYIRNSEKQLELLGSAPKDFTLLDVWKGIVDFEAQVDKVAEVTQKMTASNSNRFQ